MQADNGSLIYFMPGTHPAYSPYVPVNMIGADGQFVAQPPYSPTSVFQPSFPSPGYIPTPLPYGESLPYMCDPSIYVGDGTYGNGYSGTLEIPSFKPNMSSPSQARGPSSKKALPSDLSKSLETKNSTPTLDASSGHGMRNQLKSVGKVFQFLMLCSKSFCFSFEDFFSYDFPPSTSRLHSMPLHSRQM